MSGERMPSMGKILVVDDDRLVLATVVHGLKQAGFEVIDADNGDDAILAAREHRRTVEVRGGVGRGARFGVSTAARVFPRSAIPRVDRDQAAPVVGAQSAKLHRQARRSVVDLDTINLLRQCGIEVG